MKKTIGLYGDSYCGNIKDKGIQFHWSTLLGKSLNRNVINYGFPGSSVYYSYKKFLESYQSHNLNIFIISEPGRYIKIVDGKAFPGIGSLDRGEISKEFKEYLKGWFLSSCDDFNRDMLLLMADKIKSLDQNVLFVPGFANSVINQHDETLFGLQSKQVQCLKTDIYTLLSQYEENGDIISGHFLPIFNVIIYNAIKEKMRTGVLKFHIPENLELGYELQEAWTKKS